METGPINNAAGAGVLSQAVANGGDLGKDEFLQLLIAQLTNQDPLNPVQDQEFVAQLAQFSALEQQMVTNDQLGVLQVGQSAMVNAQVTSLIGTEATFASNELETSSEGTVPDVEIILAANAETVTVNITDEKGKTVKQIEMGAVSAGRNDLRWDGLDESGQPLEPGTYGVDVFAKDAEGNEVDASTLVTARVTGVTFESGAAQLLIGSIRVSPSSVLEVNR